MLKFVPIPTEITSGNFVEAIYFTSLGSVHSKPAILNLFTPKSYNSSTALSSNGVAIDSTDNQNNGALT